MKCVILAGGKGSRLSEETTLRPKPMVEIGDRPILWHIMKIYASHGISEFVLCLGYKGYMIKEYFANYFLHSSDVTLDVKENKMTVHDRFAEPWKVTLIDTGDETMTGGRLLAVRDYVGDETFCFTYGDGVSDVDITEELAFHRRHQRSATLLAVRPPGRFGSLEMDGDRVSRFVEKPMGDGGRINGGFFVLEPTVFDLIDGPKSVWENEPLKRLAETGDLRAFLHDGFWHPMDTLRDKTYLDGLCETGRPPWRSGD